MRKEEKTHHHNSIMQGAFATTEFARLRQISWRASKFVYAKAGNS